jgi:hypothetical protein
MLSWLREILFGKSQPEQTTFIYCECCGNELCSSNSFVSDTCEEDGNHVRYVCSKCKKASDWDFDIAPVPIKRPFKRMVEFYADPECQIVDLNTGETIKERGERILFNA